MTKQVLKQMWHERRSGVALWVELFLIALFLWYALDLVYVQVRNYLQPTGWDVEGVYQILLSVEEEEPEDILSQTTWTPQSGDEIWTLAHRLEAHDDIEAVSISIGMVPGSNILIQRPLYTRYSSLSEGIYTPEMTSSAVEVFRFRDPQGDSAPLQKALEAGQNIASTDLLPLIPEAPTTLMGDTLFQDKEMTEVFYVIGSMVHPIKNNRYTHTTPMIILPIKEDERLPFGNITELCIRVKAEAMPHFEERFMAEMKDQLDLHNYHFDGLKYIPDSFEKQAKEMRQDLLINIGILLFLLINIGIGVVGVFSNRVEEHLGEIGLRIALGSTPHAAVHLWMVEGLISLVATFVPAAIIVAVLFKVGFPDVKLIPLDLARYAEVLLLVLLIMWGTIALAIRRTTRKVTKLPPAETLREE